VSAEYAWLGLAAAVPIVIIVLVLALRGYDVTLLMRKHEKKKDEE
jgi:hypothetical protein